MVRAFRGLAVVFRLRQKRQQAKGKKEEEQAIAEGAGTDGDTCAYVQVGPICNQTFGFSHTPSVALGILIPAR